MADFTHNFWNLFIIIVTIVSILACGVFLYFLSRTKIQIKDGKVDTTGHTWDENLQEFNNPLPRWWMFLFYFASCALAATSRVDSPPTVAP